MSQVPLHLGTSEQLLWLQRVKRGRARCSESLPGTFGAFAPSANPQWATEFTWERGLCSKQAGSFLGMTEMKLSRKFILVKGIPLNSFLLSLRSKTNPRLENFQTQVLLTPFHGYSLLLTDTAPTSRVNTSEHTQGSWSPTSEQNPVKQ